MGAHGVIVLYRANELIYEANVMGLNANEVYLVPIETRMSGNVLIVNDL